MYDFQQNYIKEKYYHKAKLLFTDTDSLTHGIETNNVYKDFHKDEDKFQVNIWKTHVFMTKQTKM